MSLLLLCAIAVLAWLALPFVPPLCMRGTAVGLPPFKARPASISAVRTRMKPSWVRREILRLAALMPDHGCRALADVFNRLNASRNAMTVSKSWVNDFLRAHRHEIAVLRSELKRRSPAPVPRNQVWGFDLTGKRDANGNVHPILGIVDHGTRRALALQVLPNKSAWTLLGHLLLAIGKYGKPRAVRTDNESMFTGRVWCLVFRLIGVRRQLTLPGCPWMNGRVERFFGTLKAKLDWIEVASGPALKDCLDDFGYWYNHVRSHRNLAGWTPVEAWDGDDPYARPVKSARFFSAWDGMLTGFHLRR